MFTVRKVAQMAGYFASQQGGRINILKLMKLLYLADRESMSRHGAPISFDRFVSMDQGPVLSKTLDLIHGSYPDHMMADWEEWITGIGHYKVETNGEFACADFDCLSEADLEVLAVIWQRFSHMNQWELRDYTHKYLPEWKDPDGTSIPIHIHDIFVALGKPLAEAQELADDINAEYDLDRALARM